MGAWGEAAAVVLLGVIGVWWYLRTPGRQAGKRSAVGQPRTRPSHGARDLSRPTPQPRALPDQAAPVPRGRSSLDEPLDT
jgi:hypothetical protein